MKLKVESTYYIRGILALLCGGILFFPHVSGLFELVIVFIVYFALEGIMALVVGIEPTEGGGTRWYLLGGSIINIVAACVIFLAVGMLQMLAPRVSAVLLLYIVYSRIIVIGLFELLAGIFRRQAGAAFLRMAIGLVSIVFGLICMFFYAHAVSQLLRPFGVYFIVLGIALMIVFLQVKPGAKRLVSHESQLDKGKTT